ncbi:hypothetical protein [Actinomadura hibisca]|uniref:hypothetical protein n=1 Tax=Actinomadura hibisca TaxID=68565 RepID=UPI00082EA31F|nr:hypothetical protein [Actinomadura hibisca]
MESPADVAWWQRHQDTWELLAFDGREDGHGLPYDAASGDRRAVLAALLRATGHKMPSFLRFLLAQEAAWHRHAWGFSPSIAMAALLVAERRDENDVHLLWHAKATSFDTMCGLPYELLFAAGVAETRAHVLAEPDPDRDGLLAYLDRAGTPTDDQVQHRLTKMRTHFTS